MKFVFRKTAESEPNQGWGKKRQLHGNYYEASPHTLLLGECNSLHMQAQQSHTDRPQAGRAHTPAFSYRYQMTENPKLLSLDEDGVCTQPQTPLF